MMGDGGGGDGGGGIGAIATMMAKLNKMVAEAAQQGDFDLAWPTKAGVLTRLDQGYGGGSAGLDDGVHLMSFEDARLYELFFAILQSPQALKSCFTTAY